MDFRRDTKQTLTAFQGEASRAHRPCPRCSCAAGRDVWQNKRESVIEQQRIEGGKVPYVTLRKNIGTFCRDVSRFSYKYTTCSSPSRSQIGTPLIRTVSGESLIPQFAQPHLFVLKGLDARELLLLQVHVGDVSQPVVDAAGLGHRHFDGLLGEPGLPPIQRHQLFSESLLCWWSDCRDKAEERKCSLGSPAVSPEHSRHGLWRACMGNGRAHR